MQIRLLLAGMAFWFTAVAAFAADEDTAAAVEGYLNGRYYEIEFFVFERPQVMDFTTGETLALDRPRALPAGIRTQRLDPDRPWTDPIDPLTRLCLVYPTVTWKPAPDDAVDEAPPPDAPGRPVPVIEPRLAPEPLIDFLGSIGAYERTLDERAERWQPAENFLLAREARRVERTGLGRVLFHGRWLQNVPGRESPDPILIQAGDAITVPWETRELVGAVGVTLGRYLHFQAELYLHGPGFGLEPTAAVMRADGTVAMQSRPLPGPRYMMLSESRRMRSGEIHYLDHPKLGVVVRIDPVTLPAGLLEAYEAFQERLD